MFETVAGTYTYWLAAVDSAGNIGAPASVTTTVSQPPDFVLGVAFISTYSGTKVNAAIDGASLVLPVNTTETQATHFTSRSWATPDAQVAAGYPIFIQPGMTTGYYEEDFDCGATFAAMRVSVNHLFTVMSGVVASAVEITTATNSIFTTGVLTFTGTQAFSTNFRYIRVRITATATNDQGIAVLSNLGVTLDAKLKSLSGMVNCLSTDSGGTTVYLTDDRTAGGVKEFLDVDSIVVTPPGTPPLIAIYDFAGDPEPLSFKVLLYDLAGARASRDFVSYTVRGY